MSLNKIAHSNWFSNFITVIIIINAVLIGVQTEVHSAIINNIQSTILGIFILEILIRWFGRDSTEEYVNNYWNWFDIIIVLIACNLAVVAQEHVAPTLQIGLSGLNLSKGTPCASQSV